MKRIVALTGAGISAESGLKTFRNSDGLWENYQIEQVATFDAWSQNPKMVLDFYNERRKQIYEAKPNPAHHSLVDLEKKYIVKIITQNIDDLHERAGSKNVLHLHGEITKGRSAISSSKLYDLVGTELNLGDLCDDGSQMRPHIVWFGEPVPMMEKAIDIVQKSDYLIIIGTSLMVYPASGLIDYAGVNVKKFYIDPDAKSNLNRNDIELISMRASEGVKSLVKRLME